jgi:hypothetical protein
MCPKGVLLEEPHLTPKLHAAKYDWPEILRQYMCATTGLSRATFGPESSEAFEPKCEYVLLLLKRQSFADAFLEPVDLVQYPDYTAYVAEPLDLDTIQHRVDDFQCVVFAAAAVGVAAAVVVVVAAAACCCCVVGGEW